MNLTKLTRPPLFLLLWKKCIYCQRFCTAVFFLTNAVLFVHLLTDVEDSAYATGNSTVGSGQPTEGEEEEKRTRIRNRR